MRNVSRLVCLVVISLVWSSALAFQAKPIVLDPTYNHDRWKTMPRDLIREFRAYTVSFDSADDNDGDGTGDKWGIPEWVAHEIKGDPNPPTSGPPRPDWFTEKALFDQGIAPRDETYHFSNAFRAANPDSPQLGYDRGHMCQKLIAFRLGADADFNTHTLLNACPQKSQLNQGIWLDLEKLTATWADQFGAVWVITGPIVYGGKPSSLLGQDGEVKIAIPDAFYKIVVKESSNSNRPDVLAFNYPQEGIDYKGGNCCNHIPYLTNVDTIEALTGLDFLTALSDEDQRAVESITAIKLWD